MSIMKIRIFKKQYGVAFFLLSIGLLISTNTVGAISDQQRQIINNSIPYFNITVNNCSSSYDGSSVSASNAGNLTATAFVEKYANLAFEVGKKSGIPYEAILAQGAIESGWGGSVLSAKYNNFFGIKADSRWHGPSVNMSTGEVYNGQKTTVNAGFRVYKSVEEGFMGYGQFIHQNSRYKKALNYSRDPLGYITAIKEAGYATAPDYINTVMSVEKQIAGILKTKTNLPPSSEMTFELDPEFAGSGVVTDSSTCSSTTGGTTLATQVAPGSKSNKSLVDTAIMMAWPDRSHKNKIKQEYLDGLVATGAPTTLSYAQDCGHFVSTAIRYSGADPSFPAAGTGTMLSYMSSNPDKYTEIPNEGNTSNLEPGDIFVVHEKGSHHIYLYTGPQPGGSTVASASLGTRTGDLGGGVEFNQHGRLYHIFRLKG